MKVKDLLNETSNTSFSDYSLAVEKLIGDNDISDYILYGVYEKGISPARFAEIVKNDKEAYMALHDEIDDQYDLEIEYPEFVGVTKYDDYTNYSMRQGEKGNPDRQR